MRARRPGGVEGSQRGRGWRLNRGGHWASTCGTRKAAATHGAVGLPELESRSGGRKGTGPMGGARLSAGREREAGVGLGREKRKKLGRGKKWPVGLGSWGEEKEKKIEKERGRWAGLG